MEPILILILFKIFVSVIQAQSPLPICSDTESEVLNRRLCKLTETYPHIPFKIQPILTIQEVLELSDVDRSMTVSMHTLLSWNDTAVKVEGPNPKNL